MLSDFDFLHLLTLEIQKITKIIASLKKNHKNLFSIFFELKISPPFSVSPRGLGQAAVVSHGAPRVERLRFRKPGALRNLTNKTCPCFCAASIMLEKNIFVLYLINILISRHVNTIVYKSYQTVKLYIVVIFITSLYTSFLHRIFDSRLCDVLSRDAVCHMLTPDKSHFSIQFQRQKRRSESIASACHEVQASMTKTLRQWCVTRE